ncbi:MAG: hydrogenase iron-sulfur subunit [bacterium]
MRLAREVELVVLATGVKPRAQTKPIQQLLALQLHPEGLLLEAHPNLQPVDSPVRGVFYAGCAEGPKDVKDAGCAGCGNCAAECRFEAVEARQFTDKQILAQIEAVLAGEPESRAIVFACHWCSYAAADTVGLSRSQYPPTQVLIHTMCSARLAEKFVLRAFALAGTGSFSIRMPLCDCHYLNANRHTQRRVERLCDKLDGWGIRPERSRLEWISAAQVPRFVKTIEELEQMRATVTRAEIEETIRILKDPPKVTLRAEPRSAAEMPFVCLRCRKESRHHWAPGQPKERSCPYCESNSLRLTVSPSG